MTAERSEVDCGGGNIAKSKKSQKPMKPSEMKDKDHKYFQKFDYVASGIIIPIL